MKTVIAQFGVHGAGMDSNRPTPASDFSEPKVRKTERILKSHFTLQTGYTWHIGIYAVSKAEGGWSDD